MKGLVRGLFGPMLLGLYVPGGWLMAAAVTLLLLAVMGGDREVRRRQTLLLVLGSGLLLMAGPCGPGGFRTLLLVLGWYSVALMVSWTLGDRVLSVLNHAHLKVRGTV